MEAQLGEVVRRAEKWRESTKDFLHKLEEEHPDLYKPVEREINHGISLVRRFGRGQVGSRHDDGSHRDSGAEKADVLEKLEGVLASYEETARAFYVMHVGEQEGVPSDGIDDLLDGHERVYARPYLELSAAFRYLGPKFELVDICLESWLESHACGVRREEADEVAEVVRLLLLGNAREKAVSEIAEWKAAH